MRMNIGLILLLSINGINCLKNGKSVDSLSAYSNFIATIWDYELPASQYRCSGSILSPRHVATAGHCVHDVRNYEIYVTAGRIDLDDKQSIMVHKIYLHHNLKRLDNFNQTHAEYWLNDIAILDLVLELTWGLHVSPTPLTFRRWIQSAFDECYIMGWNYNPTDTMTSSMILQWANASMLGSYCSPPNTFLLPNEMYAFFTIVPTTLDNTDIGNSLICNGVAVGMIVGGRDLTRSLITVLTFPPYQRFIECIVAGGVVPIRDGEFRYAVSIWVDGTFRCGGFMVYDRYVVTTAHCVNGVKRAALSVVSAHLPIPSISPSSKWSLIERIEIHPQYYSIYNESLREYSTENDIAVLKLKSSLQWSPLFGLMDLPDLSQISADTPCEILRWTLPSSRDTEIKILQKSLVRILTNEENEELGFHSGAEQFRVKGFHELPIASMIDIGNPIMFRHNIIGMVVAADLSVTGIADTVTCLKIVLYKDFIIDFMMKP